VSAVGRNLVVVEAAARLLRLLGLLQSRSRWGGRELADRIGVTARTLRRDVTRLRDLGYPVDAEPGVAGGYRLGVGGRLPPLLLEDDEAIAIAVGLRLATTGAVLGVEDAAVTALAKLDGVLPRRLAERVTAVQTATVHLPGREPPRIDVDVLVTLANGCRHTEGVRFRYLDNHGRTSERSVEPLRLVHTGRHWYLVARDRDRDAWRTFRVDRVADPALTGRRYTFEDPPDPAAFVSEGTTVAAYPIQARILVRARAADVRRVCPPSMAVVEEVTGDTALLRVAAVTLASLVSYVCGLPFDLEVREPPELRDRVRAVGLRLARRHARVLAGSAGPGR
jgi:predicted DNA-binding transcriptional regulator YafY